MRLGDAGLRLLRRWRPLAVAAFEYAGKLGARSGSEDDDLIAATHGRGFLILDDVTHCASLLPKRQGRPHISTLHKPHCAFATT